MNNVVRTRFAPSPSGDIHLGNLRAALMSYVFAKQQHGKFVLRIEDTDAARTDEASIDGINEVLKLCGLHADEGPYHGPFAPYRQSQRITNYVNALTQLQQNGRIYKCFCSKEELELERQLQMRHNQAPRYSRKCLGMSPEKLLKKTEFGLPFVWRFRLNSEQIFRIKDLCKGNLEFILANFSDFTLTRPDGSFTFLFCNFVDDWQMQISHVIRGEDHVANTALQLALYDAFMVNPPAFCHLPMILGASGEKLSKRDRHFSVLSTLQDGILPQALCDYLLRIGHWNDAPPRSLPQIITEFNINTMHAASTVHYDAAQLRWLNEQWLKNLSGQQLAKFSSKLLPQQWALVADYEDVESLLEQLKAETKNLKDLLALAHKIIDLELPWLNGPTLDAIFADVANVSVKLIVQQLQTELSNIDDVQTFTAVIKNLGQQYNLPLKALYQLIRLISTGQAQGLAIDKVVAATGLSGMRAKVAKLLQLLA